MTIVLLFSTAIHEKIFIVFMVSSQVHMLIVLKLLKMADFGREQQSEQRSYFFKRCLFFLSLLCTCGLLVFFVKHRVYCHDMGITKKINDFFTFWTQRLIIFLSQPSVGFLSLNTGLPLPTWASTLPLLSISPTKI